MKNYVCFKCPTYLCKYDHIKPEITLRRCSIIGDQIEDYLTFIKYSNITSYEDKHCIKVSGINVVPPCQCLSTNLTKYKLNDKIYNSLLEIVSFILDSNDISLELYLQLIKLKNELHLT